MLNFDVKRKINTLRDILVGKVPDPKAQVEQITIALIYKFMDDMDLAGAEFGGKRVFFSGDYEKYAFTQIMLPEHSSQDRLNLYAEGIDKMVNNADLPSLFRDILRGAYIPYRDPETLNRFLKEIAEFSYDNSEDLGNAFEYLLSIMGSQGDAGQFRTPRHIIDMMVEIAAPRKDETILDPACGTAGFLISAYKYIDAQNRDEEGKSTLSGEDKKRMAQNFAGYDISPDMVRLSRVNMYLHGFSSPQISEYDTLTSLEKWDDNYDVILANPPFMTPKGGISPHNRYRVSAKRAEVLFVDYIAEHLNPTGRAAIVVPEGIVFQSQTAYKNLRRYLIEDNLLYGVISLPAGVFNPYSGVKTSILLIDKTLAKERDSILFVKLNNDGYDLGAQRREIKGTEIPYVIQVVKEFQAGKWVGDYENVVVAHKAKIAEKDYVLKSDSYVERDEVSTRWPLYELGELCNFINGRAFKPTDWTDAAQGGVPIIRIQNLNDPTAKFNYYSGEFDSRHQINHGDLLFSWSGSRGSSFGAHIWRGDTAVLNQHIFKVEHIDIVEKGYLYFALNKAVSAIEEQLHGGVGLVHITKGNLEKIRIPVPSLSVQREIVEEIEHYQGVIDGARQVTENYRSIIRIDSSWASKRLDSLCENLDRKRIPITASERETGNIPYYGASGVVDHVKDYIFNEPLLLVSEDGANLVARVTPIAFSIEGKTWVNNHAHVLRFDNYYLQKYVEFYINQMDIATFVTGAAQPKLNQESLNRIEIRIPPADILKDIVDSILEEQLIVNGNKKLIEIYQKKIKGVLSEVWGE